jgi:hypothetical protein
VTPHVLISGSILNLDKVQQIDFEPERFKVVYRYTLKPRNCICETHPNWGSFEETRKKLERVGKPTELLFGPILPSQDPNAEPVTMPFAEALKLLEQGKRIKRVQWRTNLYLHIPEDQLRTPKPPGQPQMVWVTCAYGCRSKWSPGLAELQADDWMECP